MILSNLEAISCTPQSPNSGFRGSLITRNQMYLNFYFYFVFFFNFSVFKISQNFQNLIPSLVWSICTILFTLLFIYLILSSWFNPWCIFSNSLQSNSACFDLCFCHLPLPSGWFLLLVISGCCSFGQYTKS